MQHHRWVEKEAAGVVAAIIAYNYPTQLALAKLAPALAAGCTVVLKGAPDTPLITLALGELIANHTDIPAGVVNVLSGADPEVGVALTTSPDVDMITFTGSTPTGRAIMAAASETCKRVFLELGGKSAAIVLDDGDFDMAALFTAFATASHSGQGCAITTRILVPSTAPRRDRREVEEQLRGGELRQPHRRGHLHGSVDQCEAARQGRRHGQARRRGGRDAGDRRREGEPGLLLQADASHRCRPGQRDRAARSVRAGARRHPLRGRRRCRAHRQQLHLRTVRRRVRQRGPRHRGGAPHPYRHALDQRRHVLRTRQPVRRLQAVGDRQGDGCRRTRGVP